MKEYYVVKPVRNTEYTTCYDYKAKNSQGQILHCSIYWSTGQYFTIEIHVTTKRKNKPEDGDITGKDGIKSFIWAKECLEDFLKNIAPRYKGDKFKIYAANDRLLKIYYAKLKSLGFVYKYSQNPFIQLEL